MLVFLYLWAVLCLIGFIFFMNAEPNEEKLGVDLDKPKVFMQIMPTWLKNKHSGHQPHPI